MRVPPGYTRVTFAPSVAGAGGVVGAPRSTQEPYIPAELLDFF